MSTQISGGSVSANFSTISNVEAFNGTLFPNVYYFLSLHTAAPGTTGASELTSTSGHPYIRQPVAFNLPVSGTTNQFNSTLVSFARLAAKTGGFWIGLWESQTGPDYLVGSSAVVCGNVTSNQILQFPAGILEFTGTALAVPSAPLALNNPIGGTIYGTVPYGTSYYGNPSPGAAGGVLANFSALPVTQSTTLYSLVNLSWNLPTAGNNIQLIRNSISIPTDQNDGFILPGFPQALAGSTAYYTDRTLTSNNRGKFLYYSLFVEDSSLNWWRSADWQVMLPLQYDYGPWLYSLMPEWYRDQDMANSDTIDIFGLPLIANPEVALPTQGGGTPPPTNPDQYDSGEYDDAEYT